ncbi:hydroxysteroid dehydrogenase-like protein 1 [Chironomus tepperi]|uniref:hydroxysteroid dehydrogenase-like protein 1 n=1 Tax=Chironomus tepperi TaxID=113505 RepID=UPI00391EF9BE
MESLLDKITIFYLHYQVPLFLLSLIGLYALIWWSYENFKSVLQIAKALLSPYFLPNENKSLTEKYGKWAVITGSTDGIGKQYALGLAKQGLNIVLISRTESKLEEVSKEIESMYSVKTKYIAADFGSGKEIYNEIKQKLQLLDIGILVNNVGRMYDFPDDLDNVPEDLLWQIININVGAVTMMSRIVIPQMKVNRRGIIVNISSGSECQPTPLMTVYASTKTYVRNFSLALSKELEEHNVQVQLVTPLFVQTKMNNYSTSVMKGNILMPDVESYTKFAVFTLGKSSQTTGYWSHGLQYGAMRLCPDFIRTIISFNMNRGFRNEYYDQQKLNNNNNIVF